MRKTFFIYCNTKGRSMENIINNYHVAIEEKINELREVEFINGKTEEEQNQFNQGFQEALTKLQNHNNDCYYKVPRYE